MPIQLQDNELQAVAEAVVCFLDMRLKAKRSTMEQKIRDAKLLLLLERVHLALDALTKEAVQKVASRLSEMEQGSQPNA